eukprot:262686-Chlamydomonas_euryale.AAC.12
MQGLQCEGCELLKVCGMCRVTAGVAVGDSSIAGHMHRGERAAPEHALCIKRAVIESIGRGAVEGNDNKGVGAR